MIKRSGFPGSELSPGDGRKQKKDVQVRCKSRLKDIHIYIYIYHIIYIYIYIYIYISHETGFLLGRNPGKLARRSRMSTDQHMSEQLRLRGLGFRVKYLRRTTVLCQEDRPPARM